MAKDKTALAVVPAWTEEQAQALNELHEAMGNFFGATLKCHQADIPLAEAFAAIGVEIPAMLRPMVNQLAGKLPTRNDEL